MTANMRRQQHGASITPPRFSAGRDSFRTNAEFAGHIRKRVSNVVHSHKDVITFISRLFGWGCPTNVARLIVSIYVFTIQGVSSRRLGAEQFNELFKTFKTEFNAPAAVTFKAIIRFFIATALSIFEGRIFSRTAKAMRYMVTFSVQAPARFSVTTLKIVVRDDSGVAAFAVTKPTMHAALGGVHELNNSQSAEHVSDAVPRSGWKRFKNNGIFVVVHAVFSFQNMVWARLGSMVDTSVRAVLILPQAMHMRVNY